MVHVTCVHFFFHFQLSVCIAKDLFLLFDGRHGDMIAPTNELILAFSMVIRFTISTLHIPHY